MASSRCDAKKLLIYRRQPSFKTHNKRELIELYFLKLRSVKYAISHVTNIFLHRKISSRCEAKHY